MLRNKEFFSTMDKSYEYKIKLGDEFFWRLLEKEI